MSRLLLRVVPCLQQHLDALWRTKHIRGTSCACDNFLCAGFLGIVTGEHTCSWTTQWTHNIETLYTVHTSYFNVLHILYCTCIYNCMDVYVYVRTYASIYILYISLYVYSCVHVHEHVHHASRRISLSRRSELRQHQVAEATPCRGSTGSTHVRRNNTKKMEKHGKTLL